jgi:hypothetical protein
MILTATHPEPDEPARADDPDVAGSWRARLARHAEYAPLALRVLLARVLAAPDIRWNTLGLLAEGLREAARAIDPGSGQLTAHDIRVIAGMLDREGERRLRAGARRPVSIAVNELRAMFLARAPGAPPVLLDLAARLVANPISSSDTLLLLADALREAADHEAARGWIAASADTDVLAELVASLAPARSP